VDEEIVALKRMIDAHEHIVVFTGAGISTESGIPDFRGPNGVWKTATPIDFNDYVSSEEVRKESWQRKFSGSLMLDAEPNSGHIAISHLIKVGKISHVITQNVDGLHQKSGVPEDKIIELHGNANYATCLDCGLKVELEDIEHKFVSEGTIPYCQKCHGIVKTATISFGQSMPVAEMQRAEYATLNCDMFIAIGSSLVVYPAAGFPRMAKLNGAELVILNNQATDLDPVADLVIHKQIGESLSAVID
jgi:NAD-dependent deacetylase